LEDNDEQVVGGRFAKQLQVPVVAVIVAQRGSAAAAAAGQLPITQWQPLDDIT
jgi:hypothetical protein